MLGRIVKYNYQLKFNFQNIIKKMMKMKNLKQYFNLKLILLILHMKYNNNIYYVYNKLLNKLKNINKNQD